MYSTERRKTANEYRDVRARRKKPRADKIWTKYVHIRAALRRKMDQLIKPHLKLKKMT